MNRTIATAILAVSCNFAGCRPASQDTGADHHRSSNLRERAGATPDTSRVVLAGYLTDFAMQHPRLYRNDDYLDLYDAEGDWIKQIVIVFPEGGFSPHDRLTPIEVTGRAGRIELGGPKGTKNEYANDVVFVESWRTLDPKDVPRKQRPVEPEPDGG